jgi:extracellular factor (EF) 3-hydroxypalmitic acid methyl ester biosynthesis protein
MIKQDQGEMINALLEDLFDDSLLNQVHQKLSDGKVQEGMAELFVGLQTRRLNSTDQEWAPYVSLCLNHPLRKMIHQDPITERAFSKPRGYAGDAALLDLIYAREDGFPLPAETSELGRQIYDVTVLAPAAEGVRARRAYIASLIDRLVEEVNQPHIISLGAGHLREASLSVAVKRKKVGRFVALDADSDSLMETDKNYSRYRVEAVASTVRQLLTGKMDLGDFDLIYSTGLFDYLQQSTATRLIGNMFEKLRHGGRLLVANYLPGIADLGYMQSFMAWHLIFRTRQEMIDMSMNIPQPQIRDIRIFTEENENIIFLMVTRK